MPKGRGRRDVEGEGPGRGWRRWVIFRPRSVLCSLLLNWKRHKLSNETLRTRSVEEASYKRPRTAPFHLYEIKSRIKSIGTESGSVVARDWER